MQHLVGPESYLSAVPTLPLTLCRLSQLWPWVASGLGSLAMVCQAALRPAPNTWENQLTKRRGLFALTVFGGLACGPLDFQPLAGEVYITVSVERAAHLTS